MADGTPVAGATSPTLAPDPAFVGKAITVKVTATKAGYAAVGIVSAAARPVAAGHLDAGEHTDGDAALWLPGTTC